MRKILIIITVLVLFAPSFVLADAISFRVGYFFPSVGSDLWDIENAKRRHIRNGTTESDDFRRLSILVALKNDSRADIKRQINKLTGSQLEEVKEHGT